MIDFSLTEEQELFRKAIARFAEEEIAPIADECDRRDEYPVHILKKLGELGYLGVKFPKRYGGGELGTLAQAIMLEELGRASAGITIGIYCHAVLALTPIALFGTEMQKQKYLVPGIKGEVRIADDGIAALFHAAALIASGLKKTVLVVAHCKNSESDPDAVSEWFVDPVFMQRRCKPICGSTMGADHLCKHLLWLPRASIRWGLYGVGSWRMGASRPGSWGHNIELCQRIKNGLTNEKERMK